MTEWQRHLLGEIFMFALAAFLIFGDFKSIENETWLDIAIIALSATMLLEYVVWSCKKRETNFSTTDKAFNNKREDIPATVTTPFLYALFIFCVGVFWFFFGYDLLVHDMHWYIADLNFENDDEIFSPILKKLFIINGTLGFIVVPFFIVIAIFFMTIRERLFFVLAALVFCKIVIISGIEKYKLGNLLLFLMMIILLIFGILWNKINKISKEQQVSHFVAAWKLLDFEWVVSLTARQKFYLGIPFFLTVIMLLQPKLMQDIADFINHLTRLLVIAFGARNTFIGFRDLSDMEKIIITVVTIFLGVGLHLSGVTIGAIVGIFALVAIILFFVCMIFKK